MTNIEQPYLLKFNRHLKFAAILCFVVMSLGSFVRTKDAGLSCPDWPLCYGQVIPYFDLQIFLEWFHRVLAALLTVNLVVLAYDLFKLGSQRKHFIHALFAASGLLIAQIVLGGLTVLQLIDPRVVSLHLINAVFLFGVLLYMFIKSERLLLFQWALTFDEAKTRLSKYLYAFVSMILLSQIYLGGMVSTNFAGTVCPDFPTCFGQWFPASSFLVWLQMSHRYLAFFIVLMIVIASALSTFVKLPFYGRLAARTLPLLVVIQVLLGMINVYASLPPWSTVLHLANALAMFAISSLAFFDLLVLSSNDQEDTEIRTTASPVQVG